MPADRHGARAAAEAALAAGDASRAFELLRGALRADPADASIWTALASLYLALAQPAEALEAVRRALTLAPERAEAHELAGLAHDARGDSEAATRAYRAALVCEPHRGRARLGLASLMLARGNSLEAMQQALAVLDGPDPPAAAWRVLGDAELLRENGNEAARAFERYVLERPEDAEAWHNLGLAREMARQPVAACDAFERALALDGDLVATRSQLSHLKRRLCDWRGLDALSESLRAAVREGRSGVAPFAFLSEPTSPEEQLACARIAAQEVQRQARASAPSRGGAVAGSSGERIRVGFVSSGFGNHPTGLLIVDLIERLRGGPLETVAFATTADDGGALRARLRQGFAEFEDCAAMDRAGLAERIRTRRIEVLFDLRGYGGGNVAEVFALRPAPVQVNWLAYPGTSGAPYMDYLVADAHVVPPAARAWYSEALVRLPHCFQPNDATRRVADPPSRRDCGLPETGPVFASFNNSYKIGPDVFDCWLRLLASLPQATLWLLDPGDDGVARANLEAAAERAGIAPARLCFMTKLPHAQYLARYRHVDLFLDTWPYGAHTTASDALYAGCPVLTIAGRTFASRVGVSLLGTLGLPELIARDAEDYLVRACGLIEQPAVLDALRRRLAAARREGPAFDMARYGRDFTRAVHAMSSRARLGLEPADMDLAPE